jgi:hypothetical protein
LDGRVLAERRVEHGDKRLVLLGRHREQRLIEQNLLRFRARRIGVVFPEAGSVVVFRKSCAARADASL